VDEKVLLSLISVVVGWFLAQGTAFIRDWWTVRKIKGGLKQELLDLKMQLVAIAMLYARHLQIYSHGGLDPNHHLPISNAFFKQYYKDVMVNLNSDQRRSYQLIHASIDTLNSEGAGFIDYTKGLLDELALETDTQSFRRKLNRWASRADAMFKNVRDAQWYIEYHLKNPRKPGLEVGSAGHESYLKFLEEVNAETKQIVAEAKGLKKEDLVKTFHAEFFERGAGKA
jgi:hypothetical protein